MASIERLFSLLSSLDATFFLSALDKNSHNFCTLIFFNSGLDVGLVGPVKTRLTADVLIA